MAMGLGVKGYSTQPVNCKSFAIEHSFYGITNSSINFFRGSSNSDGFISFNTYENVERMRITYTGKIGIGTTSPNSLLDVKGDITVGNTTNATLYYSATINNGHNGNGSTLRITPKESNSTPILTLRPSSGSTAIPALQIQDSPTSESESHNLILGTGTATLPANSFNISSTINGYSNANSYPIYFNVSNTTNGRITAMSISNSGNVGIGTISPEYKLDVSGTIRAKEVKVDLKGADFVFEDDYDLIAINELEKFIDINKHLPEMKAASEMEENGTELGELNSKLLRKIEEMTLYIIDLNKQIESLHKQNEELLKLKKEVENLKAVIGR